MANTQLYLIVFTALNIFLSSNAKYIGTPTAAADFRVILKSSLELKCQYNGSDGDGQFVGWYKDGEAITTDKSKHYAVKSSKKESKLTIIIAAGDQAVKKWHVKTNKLGEEEKPIECQFSQILLEPSPQRIETDRLAEKVDTNNTSVRRLQDQSIRFKCIIEPSLTNEDDNRKIRWQFSKDGEKFSKLPRGLNTKKNEIFIKSINKTHRGYYRCSFNNVSFSVLLRVKDPFAALWPFLGIVSTVLVLVVIILIYEKRQKLARKAGVVEDEVNDNANDPLVQSSNKLSDDENKKRTVKA